MCKKDDVADERVRKGITISRRIRWAPLPLQTKASQLDCVFAWTGGNVRFPCGRFVPRAGELTADSSGGGRCGARNVEADVAKLC